MCLSQFQWALSPVSISIHDTRAPARSVVHEVNCALERLARFTDNAVTNLKGEESSFNKGRVQIKDYVEICGWLFTSMRSPKPLTWNRSTDGNLFFREYFPPTLAPTLTRSSPYILARSHVQFSRLRSYSFDLCHGALVLFPFFLLSITQSLNRDSIFSTSFPLSFSPMYSLSWKCKHFTEHDHFGYHNKWFQ